MQACLLPVPPRPLRSANYARVLGEVMGGLSNMALWLRIPLVSPAAPAASQQVLFMASDITTNVMLSFTRRTAMLTAVTCMNADRASSCWAAFLPITVTMIDVTPA